MPRRKIKQGGGGDGVGEATLGRIVTQCASKVTFERSEGNEGKSPAGTCRKDVLGRGSRSKFLMEAGVMNAEGLRGPEAGGDLKVVRSGHDRWVS